MRFAEPNWLWIGAAAVALLGILVVRSERLRARALARFVAARHLRSLTPTVSLVRRWTKHVLTLAGVLSLFIALARPQWGYHFEAEKRKGTDILFAVDTSKSMLAEDLRPNRLARAKLAVEDLLGKMPSARAGLVAFAGDGFLQTPLTQDRLAFKRSLDALDAEVIQVPGTNLESAVRVAQSAFRGEAEQRKVLVILTDGEDLSSSVGAAARAAADSGITVYALGVGTAEGATIPAPGQPGTLLRGPDGELVRSHLDESALRDLVTATGGSYHALGTGGQGVTALYQSALSRLPAQLHDARLHKVFHERFQWPLGLGLLLLLLSYLFPERSRRTRHPVLMGAAAVGALFFTLSAASTASAQSTDWPAVRRYNAATGSYRTADYSAAEKRYRSALATRDLKLQQRTYYNLGNTLYRQGQASEKTDVARTIARYEKAIEAYESALALDGKDEDARFNRDFVRDRLERLKRQQENQQRPQQKQKQCDGGKQKQKQKQKPAAGGAQNKQQQQGNQGQGKGSQAAPEHDAKRGAGAKKQRDEGQQNDPGQAQAQQQPSPGKGSANATQAPGHATAGKVGKQPGQAAVSGGLTAAQAARLLDALEGELEIMPSGHAAKLGTNRQAHQAKDW